MWREKPKSLHFPSPNQVRNRHNYPRLFLNPMNNRKITFFKLWRDLESANENHTSDFRCSWIKSTWWRWRTKLKKSHKPKVFCLMTRALILTHFQWGWKEEWTLWLSLFVKMEDDSLEKVMRTLTPKGVFIGFPTRLKWLEVIKGLGHLI